MLTLQYYGIAVAICDQEYPVRPAFSLLTKLLDDFTERIPQSSFGNPSAIDFPDVTMYLQKYQDPRQADAIMKVQQELDETKIVLVRLSMSHHDHGCLC
jgi:synaptobrevin family protein YKT6